MKTVMFPLKNSNAAVIRAKIKPLLHKNAKVISFKENNVLAITATPKSIAFHFQNYQCRRSREGSKRSMVIRLEKLVSQRCVLPMLQQYGKKTFSSNH